MGASGPPYAPPTALVGGTPTVHTDIPISAVFLAIYFALALTNVRIVKANRSRGHKFLIQLFLVPYCMSRVVACVLRIAWAAEPSNIRLSIAAQIFINAGVLALFLFNVLLTQRILRAMHPEIGWNVVVRLIYKVLYVLLICSLILLITLTVINFYTLDKHIHSIAEGVLRGVTIYIFIFTVSPFPVLALCVLLPKSSRAQSFGEGSMQSKILVVLLTTCLCTMDEGFKLGTIWSPPRMKTDPAWFDSTAAFYCFQFVLEILTLITFLTSQFHKRFHVPNGSSKRATYEIDAGVGLDSRAETSIDAGVGNDSRAENSIDLEKADV